MSNNFSCIGKIRDNPIADEETTIQYPLLLENTVLFQLFFLADDKDQSVEVVETQEVDFEEVVRRLKRGESVFITRKSTRERDPSLKLIEHAEEPWYFNHI